MEPRENWADLIRTPVWTNLGSGVFEAQIQGGRQRTAMSSRAIASCHLLKVWAAVSEGLDAHWRDAQLLHQVQESLVPLSQSRTGSQT